MFHVKHTMWCAVLAVAPVVAMAQQLLPAQSEMSFVSRQMGVPVEGRFRRFDAQIRFDPARLSESQIQFRVDMASATLGVPETDAELPKAEWFDTRRFPQALFQSTGVKATGPAQYEVSGRLQIKGLSAPVTIPVTLSRGASGVTWASGQFPVQRLVFKVGDQEWSDTSMVANEVQVRFKLALNGVNFK